MRSAIPKPLHRLAGRPMVAHLIAACAEAGFGHAAVVVGPEPAFGPLREAVAPHPCFVQRDRLGTAHATLAAAEALAATAGEAMVLYGDVPLVRPATMRALAARRRETGAGLALLAFRPADPAQYGRVILGEDGFVTRIVEWRDADAAERAVGLCNAGLFCAPAADLLRWLRRVGNDNAKGEYYLTDVVAIARAEGARVAHAEAPPGSCSASIPAPSWPLPRRRSSSACAPRRWRAGPRWSRPRPCSSPGTRGSAPT